MLVALEGRQALERQANMFAFRGMAQGISQLIVSTFGRFIPEIDQLSAVIYSYPVYPCVWTTSIALKIKTQNASLHIMLKLHGLRHAKIAWVATFLEICAESEGHNKRVCVCRYKFNSFNLRAHAIHPQAEVIWRFQHCFSTWKRRRLFAAR